MVFPVFHGTLIAFCPVSGQHWQESGSIFFPTLHPPQSHIHTHWWDPHLSLLFSVLNIPSPLTLSLYVRWSKPYIIYWAGLNHLCWTHASKFMSFDGTPELDPAFQMCLTSAVKRGCNTSLDGLAMLFLMPKTLIPKALLGFGCPLAVLLLSIYWGFFITTFVSYSYLKQFPCS